MIDNFELIKPLFYFNEDNNMFFHCQIVQRNKDHKPNKVSKTLIKSYLIRSKQQLEALKDEIILLCEYYKARAYINISGKCFIDVNKRLLAQLAMYNYNNNIGIINPNKLVNSTVSKTKSENPKWIIDVDDLTLKNDIYTWLRNLGWDEYQIIEIPTVQGCHFITSKFHVRNFQNIFPTVDVHKNASTLLYYPNSLSN